MRVRARGVCVQSNWRVSLVSVRVCFRINEAVRALVQSIVYMAFSDDDVMTAAAYKLWQQSRRRRRYSLGLLASHSRGSIHSCGAARVGLETAHEINHRMHSCELCARARKAHTRAGDELRS